MSFTPDPISTEDALKAILSSSTPLVPPQEQRYGSCLVQWWEMAPGEVYIHAEGGSPQDRHYASVLTAIQLDSHGFKRAQFDIDGTPVLGRTAAWTDVMNKAKRLLMSNQVTLTSNGYNYVTGHVIGDHGEYDTEFSRDDPNSRAITGWQCFLPDAPVTLGDGSRSPIRGLDSGDEVQTHLGHIRKVTNAWSKPYQGRMARIKLQGIEEEVVATADHRFWAANDDYYLQDSVGWRGRMKIGQGPLAPRHGWTEAQDLAVGGYLSKAQLVDDRPCVIDGIEVDEELATLTAPEPVQRAFLEAYVEGDGNHDGNRDRIHSTSETMIHQVRVLLTRLGLPSALAVTHDNSGRGFVKNWKSIYWARWSVEGGIRNPTRFMRDGQAWFRIESIEFFDYDGLVYDLEVEEDHSFQVYGVNAHNCSCPWDQYAWQRTRKWKKFEGRYCSHVQALIWKSLGTPLDHELDEDQAEGMGTGQKLGPPEQREPPAGQEDLPRSFGPDGDIIQGDQQELPIAPPPEATGAPPGPAQAPLAPPPGPPPGQPGPQPPGVIPPFPGAPPEQPPYAGPGTTPGGGVSPPGAISVPGAKPPGQPDNPIQNPGTLSHMGGAGDGSDGWQPQSPPGATFNPPEVVRLKKPFLGLAEGPVPGQYGDGSYREVPAGKTGEVLSQDPTTGWVECIFALDETGPHEPFHVRGFLEPGDLDHTDATNAFIRRKSDTLVGAMNLGASVHAADDEVKFIRQKYGALLTQPGHKLWFTPNQGREPEAGRGMIHDPTGTVHTWPESEATHASMIEGMNYRPQDCCRFYIRPNGVVSQIMGPSSAFTTIMNADPSLARANGMDPA